MGTIQAIRGQKILVDDDMLASLDKHSWHINSEYARAYIDGKSIKMHRLIVNAPKGLQVDHINGNRLDNRKSNLRITDYFGNQANRKTRKDSSTGFKGVSYDKTMKRIKRWRASIYHEGKRISIGRYFTATEAAEAYDKMAIKLKGEFARLNLRRIVS